MVMQSSEGEEPEQRGYSLRGEGIWLLIYPFHLRRRCRPHLLAVVADTRLVVANIPDPASTTAAVRDNRRLAP